MGFFDFLNTLFDGKQKKNNKTNINKNKNQPDETDWETHCESCGELLEDCECDWREQSRQDIGQDEMDDLEFDEMNDVWDELDQQEMEEEELLADEEDELSFDDFDALDDDDDDLF